MRLMIRGLQLTSQQMPGVEYLFIRIRQVVYVHGIDAYIKNAIYKCITVATGAAWRFRVIRA
jgi:hypothetical protein